MSIYPCSGCQQVILELQMACLLSHDTVAKLAQKKSAAFWGFLTHDLKPLTTLTPFPFNSYPCNVADDETSVKRKEMITVGYNTPLLFSVLHNQFKMNNLPYNCRYKRPSHSSLLIIIEMIYDILNQITY